MNVTRHQDSTPTTDDGWAATAADSPGCSCTSSQVCQRGRTEEEAPPPPLLCLFMCFTVRGHIYSGAGGEVAGEQNVNIMGGAARYFSF